MRNLARFVLFLFFLSFKLFSDVDFFNPSSTPTGTSPNLSESGGDASFPQITTNRNSGQYVYAVWQRNAVVQAAVSSDFGVTWSDPATTPAGASPDLSNLDVRAWYPQITTDGSGQYVYAIWNGGDESSSVIQTAISSDFGITWTNPTTTPTGISPNLTPSQKMASCSQITTNSLNGRYVYAIWQITNDEFYTVIQTALSSDYGATWSNPASTPTGITPNLTASGHNAACSQITTDSSGRYVYAVWQIIYNSSNAVIQTAISSDYGMTWSDPVTTPADVTPNLSQSGKIAFSPTIKANDSSRYACALWARYNGSNTIIQAAISSDYGVTWSNPAATSAGETPNLSVSGRNARGGQISTCGNGEHVYAIWSRHDGSNYIIQAALSSDFGATWTNPVTMPAGSSPDLSVLGQNAQCPQIITDSSGQRAYAVWYRYDGSNYITQTAFSSDFGATWTNPATTPTGTSPNLSVLGRNAQDPQIITDGAGQRAYAVWYRYDGSNYVVQTARGVNN